MYVRALIEKVSGINKYIYLNTDDYTNKKYIKEKNIYYPIKKYKGSLKKVTNNKANKIKKGGNGCIKLIIKIYNIDGQPNEYTKFESYEIDITENEVIKVLANDSSKIMPDKDIHIFYKNIAIENTLNIIMGSSNGNRKVNNIKHFIIIKSNEFFYAYIRNFYNKDEELLNIINTQLLENYYHIIYKRNNNITNSSSSNEEFIVFFSILNTDIIDKFTYNRESLIKKKYEEYKNETYLQLYTKLINVLDILFQS